MSEEQTGKIGRRAFMGTAATAGLMLIKPELVRGTAANSAVRVGLLGCGGRGTEDASNLIDTGGARVVALADLFQDQLDKAKKHFDGIAKSKGFAGVDASQMFVGPKAFEEIVSSKEVDAVVITTPPYFHPQHLEAAVMAGKHVYCEKPVSVDVHGALKVIEIGRRAEGKLSLDVGFQIRNAPPFVELVRRIHAGALGKINCGEIYYYAGALTEPAWEGASPTEKRIRNWVWDRVLSGDIIVEQNIHVIDVCNWMLQGHPVKATGAGGRGTRSDWGDAFSHFNVVYTYPEDVHVTLNSTQFNKGWWDVNERLFGSKGTSESHYSGPCAIYGDEPWSWAKADTSSSNDTKKFSAAGAFSDNLAQADPEKKKAFIESITSNQFHNQAALGAESALTGMLGRTAAYRGEEVTWDGLLASDEHWDSGIDLNKL